MADLTSVDVEQAAHVRYFNSYTFETKPECIPHNLGTQVHSNKIFKDMYYFLCNLSYHVG